MKLEEVKMYEYTCTPMRKGDIRSVVVTVIATDDNDAMQKMSEIHKFFEQDMNRAKRILYKGFRQVEEKK